jgi:hypothetical protein
MTRRARWRVHQVGLTVVLAFVIPTPSGPSDFSPPAGEPSLSGNVTSDFPAAPRSRVAVVVSGPSYRGVIPIVVRNGSSDLVDRVVVSVTARGADHKVVGRGTTRRLVPQVVPPDRIAIGGVRFQEPAGAAPTYEFKVSSRRRDRLASGTDLQVTTTELSAPMVGSVAQRLTGELRNRGRRKVRGPVDVTVLCLNEANRPVLTSSLTAARRGLASGASAAFTIELPELCPAYLVGARSRG